MRQLHPEHRDDVDLAACYPDVRRQAPPGRPYVFVNMVSSADGATVVEGVTEQLGSAGDRRVFMFLRSLADAILVGAQTVRAEGYGPPKVRSEFRDARTARGQEQPPRLAVVSRSLHLDWQSPLFTGDGDRPFVLAPTTADPQRLRDAAEVAEVVTAGDPELDLHTALGVLRTAGVAALLCEGGPTLNAALLQAGLIDELCLTVSPSLVGRGGGAGIVGGAAVGHVPMRLAHVLEEDGYLFLRYLLGGDGR